MCQTIRRWRLDRRYRTTVRELSSLTAGQLRELGIRPAEIHRLAFASARAA